MCAPTLIPIVSAVIGAGSAMYSSNKMQKEQEKQRREQEALARQQANQRTDMEGVAVHDPRASGQWRGHAQLPCRIPGM